MQHPGTYQTRISGYAGVSRGDGDAALSAYGELYGHLQRKLFSDVAAGRAPASLKGEYRQRYGIPARMFNAVRVSLDGKVASVKEQQKLRLDDLQRRIARAERQVSDADERGRQGQVHQKKRRLANLCSGLVALEADIRAGRVRLCFGSKRLWRKQYHLRVARDFPSSQLCHDCGHRQGKMDLQIRRWACPKCGASHDRDANAALNIRDYGP